MSPVVAQGSFSTADPNRTPIHLLVETLGKFGYEGGRTATIDLLAGEGDPDRLNALVA
jgi:putative tryptophan/tyrosine transport system substrate-binding protein